MRRILHILLLFVLLSVVADGCRRTDGGEERRLVAIDSLIASRPDSALALLARVDTAALAEPDRAYHALLTVVALYKAYIPATSDSLIARAWRYYEHGGPYDRRVRAMIHQGTVAEELGHPEQAMRWYKQAEAFARPDATTEATPSCAKPPFINSSIPIPDWPSKNTNCLCRNSSCATI